MKKWIPLGVTILVVVLVYKWVTKPTAVYSGIITIPEDEIMVY